MINGPELRAERREETTTYKGILTFYSETETEGGFWAFVDEKFMNAPDRRLFYERLHLLKDGNELTIYDKEDPEKVVWEGIIALSPFTVFKQSTADGRWIHNDQTGIDRETWASWFTKGNPAKLTVKASQTKK